MFGFQRIKLLVIGICLLGMGLAEISTASAQPRRLQLPFGRKPKAVEQDSFELTQQAGPWLILCASFVGDEADMHAQQLCEELQQRLNVPTYIYKHSFDYTNRYQGYYYSAKEFDVDANGNRIPKRKPTRPVNNAQFEEVAVLVGDFPSLEDGRCHDMLERIKSLQIESLGDLDEVADDQSMRMFREAAKRLSKSQESKSKGPMGAAFVLPNPLLPEEYFAASPVDHTILQLNKGIENSLLDCPGNYSIRVATFRGGSTFNLEEIQKEENRFKGMLRTGKAISESKLAEASRKCHILCEELRKLGVEAYEFHDRAESYVCVGSYEWLSRDDGAGGKYFNPEIEKTILLFKGSVENLPNQQGAFTAKSLPSLERQGIAFDVQPVPVAVPRATSQQTAKNPFWGGTKRR